jgi:hypothetical protein
MQSSPQERRKSTLTEEDRTAIAVQLNELLRDAPGLHLSDDEQRWVRMAIKKEAQSIAFRNAVIEKSLGGLVWAGIAFAGYLMLEFLKAKGFKA